ncbi:hypothetical protein [Natrarchaeobaculum aegyptiacum]|nr:hypothetical protein [Natrarchaeobaculum aegyptiacum]
MGDSHYRLCAEVIELAFGRRQASGDLTTDRRPEFLARAKRVSTYGGP